MISYLVCDAESAEQMFNMGMPPNGSKKQPHRGATSASEQPTKKPKVEAATVNAEYYLQVTKALQVIQATNAG